MLSSILNSEKVRLIRKITTDVYSLKSCGAELIAFYKAFNSAPFGTIIFAIIQLLSVVWIAISLLIVKNRLVSTLGKKYRVSRLELASSTITKPL